MNLRMLKNQYRQRQADEQANVCSFRQNAYVLHQTSRRTYLLSTTNFQQLHEHTTAYLIPLIRVLFYWYANASFLVRDPIFYPILHTLVRWMQTNTRQTTISRRSVWPLHYLVERLPVRLRPTSLFLLLPVLSQSHMEARLHGHAHPVMDLTRDR